MPGTTYYRITKYDPKSRNEKGWYIPDEWTDYSDIRNGRISATDFNIVEAEFIKVIRQIFRFSNISKVQTKISWFEWELENFNGEDPALHKLFLQLNELNIFEVESTNFEVFLKLMLRGFISTEFLSNADEISFELLTETYLSLKIKEGTNIQFQKSDILFIEKAINGIWREVDYL